MLNQVQHDNRGAFNVTLNHVLNLILNLIQDKVQDLRFQGLMNTDTSVFDYGLWEKMDVISIYPVRKPRHLWRG